MDNTTIIDHFKNKGMVIVNLLTDKDIDLSYLFKHASTVEAYRQYYIVFKKKIEKHMDALASSFSSKMLIGA